MRFDFHEIQEPYVSRSQRARVWSERWVADWMYCPNCGHGNIDQFRANQPVADFHCDKCKDQYELKSGKRAFGKKVANGAYEKKCQRLQSSTSPNFILLNYELASTTVKNVCVVPKHFFVPEIVEKRRPLAPTARRAGWVGSNILLSRIPLAGRIYLARDGIALCKDAVMKQWQQTLFLRDEKLEERSWLIAVMNCVDMLDSSEFTLDDVYAFETRLQLMYPNNNNIRPKIRQQLQILRDYGYIEFVSRGCYRRT
jgi:type II restriction enzyme